MKTYGVTVPFAGHLFIEVEAEDEEAAIEAAIETCTIDHVEGWEALRQFNQGNVCYCPQPWEAETDSPDDEDTDDGVPA